MALTLVTDRQTVLSAEVTINLGDVTTDVAENAFLLPTGATVVGGDIVVVTAFDSGTSDVISVGDTSVTTRYASSVSIASAARTALTLTGFRTTAPTYVRIVLTHTGTAATTGKVRVRVEYVVEGRVTESQ